MGKKTLAHFSPALIIFCSMLFTIFVGTVLLAFPVARTQPIPAIDLLFTAASATCVTGLMTVPLTAFSSFGQIIIMILVQIGGLGLITLTMFLMSLFVEFGFTTQLMAGQLLQLESWKKVKQFIMFIIGLTLFFEMIGAACTYLIIKPYYSTSKAIFLATFHSISSFCNAGIGLIDDNTLFYASHDSMLVVTICLMLSGGLGFITWTELFKYLRSLHRRKKYSFSLHSKIILYATVLLIALSTGIIFMLEFNHAFAQMDLSTAALHSLFQAVSFRSAGLVTVDITTMRIATLFVSLMIAFIGTSPGSTGSGIKITTLALFLATIKAAVTGRNSVEIRGRSIAQDQAYKAIAIISLSLMWIALTLFILLLTEQAVSFFGIFFEVIAAFTTLGISINSTALLSPLGKIVIMLSMLIGRIGSLTLILALRELRSRHIADKTDFSYPEERVLLT